MGDVGAKTCPANGAISDAASIEERQVGVLLSSRDDGDHVPIILRLAVLSRDECRLSTEFPWRRKPDLRGVRVVHVNFEHALRRARRCAGRAASHVHVPVPLARHPAVHYGKVCRPVGERPPILHCSSRRVDDVAVQQRLGHLLLEHRGLPEGGVVLVDIPAKLESVRPHRVDDYSPRVVLIGVGVMKIEVRVDIHHELPLSRRASGHKEK
mmetsp:Transcript_25585/g.74686  ORF Transcript_25585/g.74686 Transcript_25585/m.74686 type:complete len:211 (-) Transcript_25585:943-1575(-)